MIANSIWKHCKFPFIYLSIYLFIYFIFLHKGKDKIKRLALVSDYSDGGLKMPYLESTIKAQEFCALKSY